MLTEEKEDYLKAILTHNGDHFLFQIRHYPNI